MHNKTKIVVLGGGVGGLATAYYFTQSGKYDVIVLEKEAVIGGLCSSFQHQGFMLDYGAHKLYSAIPGIMAEISDLFDGKLLRLPKRNKIFLRHKFLEYPLKLSNLTKVLGFFELFKLGLGFIFAALKGLFDRSPAVSYEDYMVKRFGRPAYELVFQPLAEKVWGKPASLHANMAEVRVPAKGGMELILKLLGIKKEKVDSNAEFFFYPREGFYRLPEAMKEKIEKAGGNLFVDVQINELKREQDKVVGVVASVAGQTQYFPCDYLISTIPLQQFAPMILSSPKAGTREAITRLESRHLILVYIFIKCDKVLDDQWVFFPEKRYLFSRIFEQKQMNPELGPPGQTSICCDFTCEEESWQWRAPDYELAQKCIDDLNNAGIINRDEVAGFIVKRFKGFYPRYDLNYEQKLLLIFNDLKKVKNILLSGRLGMYNYNNCDHCLDMAMFIRDQMVNGIIPVEINDQLVERVKRYKIVD